MHGVRELNKGIFDPKTFLPELSKSSRPGWSRAMVYEGIDHSIDHSHRP